jgi:hypothetical protein
MLDLKKHVIPQAYAHCHPAGNLFVGKYSAELGQDASGMTLQRGTVLDCDKMPPA